MTHAKKRKSNRQRIPIAQLSFNENPAEYEAQLRSNLSGRWHTKKSLVEYGVRAKIEQKHLQNKIAYYREKLSSTENEKWAAIDEFIGGERDAERVGKTIAAGRENQAIELVLKLSKVAAKAKISETNAASATATRATSPTIAQIKKFHSEWEKENHGVEHGWKKEAANHFGVSYSTIRRLAKRCKL